MKFLEKIRSLPEKTRKIILWVVVIVLALTMLIWWIGRIPQRLNGFQFGQFVEELDLPKITAPQIPDLPAEEIQKVKDSLNNIETNAQEATSTQEN